MNITALVSQLLSGLFSSEKDTVFRDVEELVKNSETGFTAGSLLFIIHKIPVKLFSLGIIPYILPRLS